MFRTAVTTRLKPVIRGVCAQRNLATASASKVLQSPEAVRAGLLVGTLGVTYYIVHAYTCKGPKGKPCNCKDETLEAKSVSPADDGRSKTFGAGSCETC